MGVVLGSSCAQAGVPPKYLMEIMLDQIWKTEWKGQTSHQGFYTCSCLKSFFFFFTKLYKWI